MCQAVEGVRTGTLGLRYRGCLGKVAFGLRGAGVDTKRVWNEVNPEGLCPHRP
jgi:hypothetical protein